VRFLRGDAVLTMRDGATGMASWSFSPSHPVFFPKFTGVKVVRHGEQQAPNHIENEPCNKEPHHRPGKRAHCAQLHDARAGCRGDAREAPGANDTVLVFDDAFAAKKTPALRTARDSFALDMMEAALKG